MTKKEKEQPAKDYSQVDDGQWVKHTPYHWSRTLPPNERGYSYRLDYWPTTDRYFIDDLTVGVKVQPNAFEFLKGFIKP